MLSASALRTCVYFSVAYEIKCSTEGSTGVVLSDLRNVDRPGACVAAPCAMAGLGMGVGLSGGFRTFIRASVWGRGAVASRLFRDKCCFVTSERICGCLQSRLFLGRLVVEGSFVAGSVQQDDS